MIIMNLFVITCVLLITVSYNTGRSETLCPQGPNVVYTEVAKINSVVCPAKNVDDCQFVHDNIYDKDSEMVLLNEQWIYISFVKPIPLTSVRIFCSSNCACPDGSSEGIYMLFNNSVRQQGVYVEDDDQDETEWTNIHFDIITAIIVNISLPNCPAPTRVGEVQFPIFKLEKHVQQWLVNMNSVPLRFPEDQQLMLLLTRIKFDSSSCAGGIIEVSCTFSTKTQSLVYESSGLSSRTINKDMIWLVIEEEFLLESIVSIDINVSCDGQIHLLNESEVFVYDKSKEYNVLTDAECSSNVESTLFSTCENTVDQVIDTSLILGDDPIGTWISYHMKQTVVMYQLNILQSASGIQDLLIEWPGGCLNVTLKNDGKWNRFELNATEVQVLNMTVLSVYSAGATSLKEVALYAWQVPETTTIVDTTAEETTTAPSETTSITSTTFNAPVEKSMYLAKMVITGNGFDVQLVDKTSALFQETADEFLNLLKVSYLQSLGPYFISASDISFSEGSIKTSYTLDAHGSNLLKGDRLTTVKHSIVDVFNNSGYPVDPNSMEFTDISSAANPAIDADNLLIGGALGASITLLVVVVVVSAILVKMHLEKRRMRERRRSATVQTQPLGSDSDSGLSMPRGSRRSGWENTSFVENDHQLQGNGGGGRGDSQHLTTTYNVWAMQHRLPPTRSVSLEPDGTTYRRTSQSNRSDAPSYHHQDSGARLGAYRPRGTYSPSLSPSVVHLEEEGAGVGLERPPRPPPLRMMRTRHHSDSSSSDRSSALGGCSPFHSMVQVDQSAGGRHQARPRHEQQSAAAAAEEVDDALSLYYMTNGQDSHVEGGFLRRLSQSLPSHRETRDMVHRAPPPWLHRTPPANRHAPWGRRENASRV